MQPIKLGVYKALQDRLDQMQKTLRIHSVLNEKEALIVRRAGIRNTEL